MTGVNAPGRARLGVGTLRRDRWWLAPLATFVGQWTIQALAAVPNSAAAPTAR